MTTLFIIRHGETEWNLSGLHHGHMDSRLTPAGERQAQLLGKRFASEGTRFDAVYTSDLGRAMQSVQRICRAAGQQDIIQKEPRLRERALGLLEGLTYAEIAEQMPGDHKQHTSGDPDYRPEGGESWRDIYNRTGNILNELAHYHDGGCILCVTHGGVISMAMKSCMGMDLAAKRRFHIQNTALNVLERHAENDWQLRTWGDTAHLRGEAALDEML
ncbi:MAG: histidine phosphatase family protein [Verrucomicrobiales bacterium]